MQDLITSNLSHAHGLSSGSQTSEEGTMGQIVVEILTARRNLNRKVLCDKLLERIEYSQNDDQKMHYIGCLQLLLERDA